MYAAARTLATGSVSEEPTALARHLGYHDETVGFCSTTSTRTIRRQRKCERLAASLRA